MEPVELAPAGTRRVQPLGLALSTLQELSDSSPVTSALFTHKVSPLTQRNLPVSGTRLLDALAGADSAATEAPGVGAARRSQPSEVPIEHK